MDFSKPLFCCNLLIPLARQTAEAARKNAYRDATVRAKEQRKLEKAVDKSGLFEQEHYDNVRVMNSYRQEYSNKINFRFRPNYTVDMKPEVVKNERKQFEILLNSQDLPTIMKDLLCKLFESVEKLSVWANLPYANLARVAETVKLNADSGYFDEEIKQLAIAWQPWLARGPEQRLLVKLGIIVGQVASENAGLRIQHVPPPQPTSESFRRTQQRAQDL